jgi:hypothetical protein
MPLFGFGKKKVKKTLVGLEGGSSEVDLPQDGKIGACSCLKRGCGEREFALGFGPIVWRRMVHACMPTSQLCHASQHQAFLSLFTNSQCPFFCLSCAGMRVVE